MIFNLFFHHEALHIVALQHSVLHKLPDPSFSRLPRLQQVAKLGQGGALKLTLSSKNEPPANFAAAFQSFEKSC